MVHVDLYLRDHRNWAQLDQLKKVFYERGLSNQYWLSYPYLDIRNNHFKAITFFNRY